jgi:hypothetical protein
MLGILVRQLFAKPPPGTPLVRTLSLKDMYTSTQLVQALKQWVAGDLSGLIKERDVVADDTSVMEVLWELALRLRRHCRYGSLRVTCALLC